MTIRRLDVFFRTQLTFDQPRVFNSITNCALAPLQHLVGQKQFQSLKGKVSYVPQITEVPSGYVETLFKVVVFVCDFFVAIVLTPIGIAARYMSFRSPQIDRAYSVAFLLQLLSFERTPELMESSFAFIRKMPELERIELLNDLPEDLERLFLSLPAHRDITNEILSQLLPKEQIELLKTLPAFAQGSFLSLDANAEFSKEYLLGLTEAEYNQLYPYLSVKLIETYPALKAENTKKQSLDVSLFEAIQSLESLEPKLKAHGAKNQWVDQFRSDPLYPFPFYLAQQLETHPKIVARADKTLWERVLSLRKSCLAFVSPDCDNELLKTTQAQANATLKATFTPNVRFFTELQGKFKSNKEAAEIKDWIEGVKREPNYSYPFYTQPRILKFMSQTKTAEQLQPISDLFSYCSTFLYEKGLQEYISEKPGPDHAAVNALMQALDQLEIISKLQQLIKTQTA